MASVCVILNAVKQLLAKRLILWAFLHFIRKALLPRGIIKVGAAVRRHKRCKYCKPIPVTRRQKSTATNN